MTVRILTGDVRDRLADLPDGSVQCVVTSPPYFGLRDYQVPGQIGLEPTLAEYVATMVAVFRDVRRVLRDDGTLWLNIGDSYNAYNGGAGPGSKLSQRQSAARPMLSTGFGLQERSLKPKDLMMVPARLALALQDDGWYLRSEIIWAKKAPMPESVRDRPTCAHEKIFLLTKAARYFYNADAVREPLAESSIDRLSQDIDNQVGSDRANGGAKTNGAMKAVVRMPSGRVLDKQRGHSRRHAGFNDRWDSMTREEQQANGANLRNVWHIGPDPYSGAHFAVMPKEIARRCILAGTKPGDTVLDPFAGAGTTLLVADRLGRDAIGIELNATYAAMIETRVTGDAPLFARVDVA